MHWDWTAYMYESQKLQYGKKNSYHEPVQEYSFCHWGGVLLLHVSKNDIFVQVIKAPILHKTTI